MSRRPARASALAAVALILSTTAVFADNLQSAVVVGGNQITRDASGNASLDYVLGNPAIEVRYYIDQTGQTCDAPTTVTIAVPAHVTATYASTDYTNTSFNFTLTACGTATSNYTAVFFSSDQANSSGYVINATSSNTAINDNPADFRFHVDAASTPGCTTPAVPTITVTPSSPSGTNGWYTSAPTFSSSASGVQWASEEFQGGVSQGKSGFLSTAPTVGAGTWTVYAKAVSGTCESAETSVTVKVDGQAPALNVNAPSGTYDLCTAGVPAAATFSPDDTNLTHDVSGVNSTASSITTTPPSTATGAGTYNWSAHAEDNASNAANASGSYKVLYLGAFNGPLQPVNADGSSRFKLGSTVPIKFTLSCSGSPINNAVAALNVKKYDSTPDPGVDEAISTAASTTGNLFRYDSTGGQYIFNLSTKLGYTNPGGSAVSFSAGTWTLSILLDDGTYRSFSINLVK